MNGPRAPSSARVVLALTLLVITGALAVAACSRSGKATSTSKPTSASSTAVSSMGPATGALPLAATATGAQLAAAYAADVSEGKPTIGLFAKDAVLQDRATGALRVGVKAIAKYQHFWSEALTFEALSRLVGSDGFVVESMADGVVNSVDVLRVRDGSIVVDYVYHDDLQQQPGTCIPTSLETASAPSDTEAASGAVATAYMSALGALDPARLAPLYARQVVYMDTGRDARYVGPFAALRAHATMFTLKGVRFQANGLLDGPGWAAVMWKRTDREGGRPLVSIPTKYTRWGKRPTIHGVSILEIRHGQIARETIYCDHLRTRY